MRLLFIYTGGTIGMVPSEHGYSPGNRLTEDLAQVLNSFMFPTFVYDVLQFENLLDSSEMGPANWDQIVQTIKEKQVDYDAFIVLHGTDTLAFTASALEYPILELRVPVVVTGSVVPLVVPGKDGVDNIHASVAWIMRGLGAGVWVVFGDRVMPACRVTKVSVSGRNAFDAPRLPQGVSHINPPQMRAKIIQTRCQAVFEQVTSKKFVGYADIEVAIMHVYPGFTGKQIMAVLEAGVRGIILECYGAGTGPARMGELVQALKYANQQGVVVAATTQCLYGSLDINTYAASADLVQAGMVSINDMTSEAALTKLAYLLGCGFSAPEIINLLPANLAGEIR